MLIIDINDNQREAKSITPDPNYPGFLKIEFQKRFDWYSIKEFLEKNPTLSHLIKKVRAIPEDTLGVVTSSSENTIRDSKQKWKENAYTGFIAWISRGMGEGQKRTVISNTANSVTVESPWETKPNTTSQYVLSHNIHEAPAMGNTLPQEDVKALEKEARKIDKKMGIKTTKNSKKAPVLQKVSKKSVKPTKKNVKKSVKMKKTAVRLKKKSSIKKSTRSQKKK